MAPRHTRRLQVALARAAALSKETEQLAEELRERRDTRGETRFFVRRLALDVGFVAVAAGVVSAGCWLVSLVGAVVPMAGFVAACFGVFVSVQVAGIGLERRARLRRRLYRLRVLELDALSTTAGTTSALTTASVPATGRRKNGVRSAAWALEDHEPEVALAHVVNDDSVEAAALRGAALHQLGRHRDARESLRRAVTELRGGDVLVLTHAAVTGIAVGLHEDVLAMAERIPADPKNVAVAIAAIAAAVALSTREALERAARVAAPSIEKFERIDALYRASDLLRHFLGGPDDDARFDRIGGVVTRTPAHLFCRGRRRLCAGNIDDALAAFRAAQRAGAKDDALWWLFAEALRVKGDVASAKAMVARTSPPARLHAAFHIVDARIADLEGRNDDARAAASRAIDVEEDVVERVVRQAITCPFANKPSELDDARSLVRVAPIDDDARAAFLSRLDHA